MRKLLSIVSTALLVFGLFTSCEAPLDSSSIIEEEVPVDTLNISISELVELCYFPDDGENKTLNFSNSQSTDAYTVETYNRWSIYLKCFTAVGYDEPSVVLVIGYWSNSHWERNYEKYNSSVAQALPDAEVYKYTIDKYTIHAYTASDSPLDYSELPLRVWPEQDFFADEQRLAQYEKYIDSFDYAGIQEMAQLYIEEASPVETDNVYTVLELIDSSMDYMDNCIVVYDDFAETHTLYYNGLTEINSSTCIVPRAEPSKWGNITYRIGFTKSNWLFFDKITIKTSDGEFLDISVPFVDKQTSVISGSTILEYYETSRVDKVARAIGESESPSIRFTNTDTGEVFDHVMSEQEIAAIVSIYGVCATNTSLYVLISTWESPV